jgi:hypothetical protein
MPPDKVDSERQSEMAPGVAMVGFICQKQEYTTLKPVPSKRRGLVPPPRPHRGHDGG